MLKKILVVLSICILQKHFIVHGMDLWNEEVQPENLADEEWDDGERTSRNTIPINTIDPRLTRAGNLRSVFKRRYDQKARRGVFFENMGSRGLFTSGPRNKYATWVAACLNDWKNKRYALTGQTGGTLAVGGTQREGVRLDQQGSYTWGGARYLNLQLQINGKRGDSSIASVQVESIIAERNPHSIVESLRYSFEKKTGVHMRTFNAAPPRRG